MISRAIMPDLGATGEDVILEEWLVRPGDTVEAGQPLFVANTDKASVEVEAFRQGVVRQLCVDRGDSVVIGAVVALLADSVDEPLATAGRGPRRRQLFRRRLVQHRRLSRRAESGSRQVSSSAFCM